MKLHYLLLGSVLLAAPTLAFQPNATELALADLIANDPGQQRAQFIRNDVLSLVARAKAQDMANRFYASQVDPDGYGPNKLLLLAGYGIPEEWAVPLGQNFVQSIGINFADPADLFNDWVNGRNSTHVLGEISFFRAQIYYGVGYAEAPDNPAINFYVFTSAPPDPDGPPTLDPYITFLFDQLVPLEIDTGDDASDLDNDGLDRVTEFAVGGQLKESTALPVPTRIGDDFAWTLPLPGDLGSVSVEVEFSPDAASFAPDSVTQNGNTFSVETASERGFFQLNASRP